MMMDESDGFPEKFESVATRDDVEGLVKLFHEYPDDVVAVAPGSCAVYKAKKCLTALISGEIFQPPPAVKGCETFIHPIAYYFPDPDVIDILFKQGAIKDLNIKCAVTGGDGIPRTPLEFVLDGLRSGMHLETLYSWSPGDSIFKLIILLCQWEAKHRLDAARQFACNTYSVNNIAWTFLETGKLMQLAALLLVARKEVMVPFESGMTIQQRLENLIDALSSKADLDNQWALYKSMLMEASKLFDVFEEAGDSLSLYCRLMCKQVTPDKVLVDVVSLLKRAGFALQSADLDLRDCYRDCLELWKPNLFKLSNYTPRLNNTYFSHPYRAGILSSCTAPGKLPSRHWDPLLVRFKSGEVLKLASSAPRPRLLSSTACQIDQTCSGSSVPLNRLAHIAMKLKRRI